MDSRNYVTLSKSRVKTPKIKVVSQLPENPIHHIWLPENPIFHIWFPEKSFRRLSRKNSNRMKILLHWKFRKFSDKILIQKIQENVKCHKNALRQQNNCHIFCHINSLFLTNVPDCDFSVLFLAIWQRRYGLRRHQLLHHQ